jgi:serine/threonine protein kinase/WD40 repeat protein
MNDPRNPKPKPQTAPTVPRPPQSAPTVARQQQTAPTVPRPPQSAPTVARQPQSAPTVARQAQSAPPVGLSGPARGNAGANDVTIQSPAAKSSRPASRGTRLDKYVVLSRLGEGGMGLVFLGRHPVSGSPVAIKMIRPEFAGDERSVHRFLTEARHMSRLSHPNLLKVLDVSDRPAGPFYVMPFMEKGSLAKLLEPGQPLPVPLTLQIAMEIASGLAHAHEKGIIHRDLKPANVLLDEGGHACLSDFGLVRTVFNDSLVDVRQSQCEGTAVYMSPGVANGAAEDTRCDIYAFGAMLYEMLTGKLAYEGISSMDVIAKVRAGPPVPILTRNPAAHPGLTKIAQGAMARELRDRYSTMDDVLADLKCVELGKSPRGPHGSEGRGVTRRVLLAAMLCVIAGVAAFVVYLKYFSSPSQTASSQSPPQLAQGPGASEDKPAPSRIVPANSNTSAPRRTPPVDVATVTAPDPAPIQKGVANPVEHRVDPGEIRGENAGIDFLRLMMIDPNRDAWAGAWKLNAGGLTVSPTGNRKGSMMLAIPYIPPAEYDFQVEFTREGDSGEIEQILSQNGRRFSYAMDAGPKHLWGFRQISSGSSEQVGQLGLAGGAHPGLMTPGAHVSVVSVREGSLSATLDGRQIASWPLNSQDKISPSPAWDLGRPVLGIGASGCRVIFSSIRLNEGKGVGQPSLPHEPDKRATTFPRLMGNAESVAMSKGNTQVLLSGGIGSTCGYDVFRYPSGDDLETDDGTGSPAVISPTGRYQGYLGPSAHVDDIGSRQVVHPKFPVTAYCFSENDSRVAVLMRRDERDPQWILGIHDLPSGGSDMTPQPQQKHVSRCINALPTLSPDGNLLIWSREAGELCLCNLSKKSDDIIPLPDKEQHWTAHFSPDSSLLLLTSDGNAPARLVDARSATELCSFQQGILSAAFAADGKSLVLLTRDNQLQLRDLHNPQQPVDIQRFPTFPEPITSIALSRDGRHLLVAHDLKLTVLNVNTGGEITTFSGFNAPIVAAAFSPDGTLALSTCQDHCVRIFKMPSP